jgi:hypothetical protein
MSNRIKIPGMLRKKRLEAVWILEDNPQSGVCYGTNTGYTK